MDTTWTKIIHHKAILNKSSHKVRINEVSFKKKCVNKIQFLAYTKFKSEVLPMILHSDGQFMLLKGPVKKKYGGGGGQSREGVGHEVLSLVQGVGHAIFRYP